MRRVSWRVNVASVCAILEFLLVVSFPPAETSVDSGPRLQSGAGLSAHNQSRERSEWVRRAPMTDPQPATRVHVRVWAGTMFTLEQRLEASFEHCRQVPHSAAPAPLPRDKAAGRPTVLRPRFGNQSFVHQCTDARKTPESASPRLIFPVDRRSFLASDFAWYVVSESADRATCLQTRTSRGTHETGRSKLRQGHPLMFTIPAFG